MIRALRPRNDFDFEDDFDFERRAFLTPVEIEISGAEIQIEIVRKS